MSREAIIRFLESYFNDYTPREYEIKFKIESSGIILQVFNGDKNFRVNERIQPRTLYEALCSEGYTKHLVDVYINLYKSKSKEYNIQ